MRLLPLTVAAAIAMVAGLFGCDQDCGDAVYPTQSDIGPDGRFLSHTGRARVYAKVDEIPPLHLDNHGVRIVEEVSLGDGRFAQVTRLMTVRFTAMDATGKELGGGEVTFLYPPVDHRGPSRFLMGWVPDSFANGLAGMRVGGERVITAPVGEDKHRAFTTKGETRSIFMLPEMEHLTYRVNLLSVCRPTVCVRKVHSIPVMTNTELYIKSCD